MNEITKYNDNNDNRRSDYKNEESIEKPRNHSQMQTTTTTTTYVPNNQSDSFIMGVPWSFSFFINIIVEMTVAVKL